MRSLHALRRGAFRSAVAAMMFAASPALANGRYPYAQQLLVDPSNADRL
jgi:hypothetical protein